MKVMIIKKVLERKDGVKMVIIPKRSVIKGGNYVKIIKMEEEENGRGERKD